MSKPRLQTRFQTFWCNIINNQVSAVLINNESGAKRLRKKHLQKENIFTGCSRPSEHKTTHTRAHTHTHAHTQTRTYTHTHTHTHSHARTHARTLSLFLSLSLSHTHTYTYTHTHTRTHFTHEYSHTHKQVSALQCELAAALYKTQEQNNEKTTKQQSDQECRTM